MVESQKSRSWWQTLPGVLTAVAAVITAVTGMIIALEKAGVFSDEPAPAPQASSQPAGAQVAEAQVAEAQVAEAQVAGTAKETAAPDPAPTQPATTASKTEAATPPATTPATPPATTGVQQSAALPALTDKIDLLSAENGGGLVVASSAEWKETVDGKTDFSADLEIGAEAVYAFEGDRPARFDAFRVLIHGADTANLQEFELLAGNDSPNGKFKSLGRFKVQNQLSLRDPFQEIKLPQTKARYLKMRIVSSYGHAITWNYEFQLMGQLEE